MMRRFGDERRQNYRHRFRHRFLFNTLMTVFKGWKEYPTKEFGAPFRGGSVSLENNPALLGVGYIIGPRIAGIMFAGGALSYLVLIPMIKYFGEGLLAPLAPATVETRFRKWDSGQKQHSKHITFYISARARWRRAEFQLVRSLPTSGTGLKAVCRFSRRGGESQKRKRCRAPTKIFR
jgi:hypothetical protein